MFAVQVPGMTCRHHVRLVTALLRDLPGVITVQADGVTGELVVEGSVTPAQVHQALLELDLVREGAAHPRDCDRTGSPSTAP